MYTVNSRAPECGVEQRHPGVKVYDLQKVVSQVASVVKKALLPSLGRLSSTNVRTSCCSFTSRW